MATIKYEVSQRKCIVCEERGLRLESCGIPIFKGSVEEKDRRECGQSGRKLTKTEQCFRNQKKRECYR